MNPRREIGFAKPQVHLLDAEVPCNYIYCRHSGSTSESFRKTNFPPSLQFYYNLL